MPTQQKGITLIELIVVISVIAIIVIPFSNAFRTTLSIWKKGSKSLELSKSAHIYTNTLKQKLHYIQSINKISLTNNTQGFISFTDGFNQTFIIFANSTENQTSLKLPNSLATNNIVMSYVETNPTVELLIPKSTYFNLESYAEDDSKAFKVVSANNITSPNYDEINSIKFVIKITDSQLTERIEHIVDLSKTPIKDAGSALYGDQNNTFEALSLEKENIELVENNFLSDGDIIRLEQVTNTITIQHSGKYFSTITAALAEAKPGDTLLVGTNENGYNENINIPAGVSVKGGYNPITWERNFDKYPTIIKTKEGVNITTDVTSVILLNTNASIDGVQIDAKSLDVAIYAKNALNISIRNSKLSNCDIGIYLENSSGDIIQNEITANKNTLSINDSNDLLIARNNLISNNFAQKENVSIKTSSKLNIYNNLITNGYSGMNISNVSNSLIVHNAFTKAQNFALDLTNVSSCNINNNIFSQNNLGIILSSASPGSISNADLNNNFFANNKFGNSVNLNLNASNIAVSLSDNQWENSNPYFTNITTFTLKDNSALIDAGLANEEVYTNSNPSKGTSKNDIGLYGGALAGRVGIANHIELTTNLTNSALSTKITDSFPGDNLVFSTGSFNISTPITLKPYQYLGGTNSRLTILNHLSSSTLINITNENTLEHFLINANTNNALLISNSTQQDIRNLIIKNANTAITIQNSIGNIRNITLYDCSKGATFSNSTGEISFSIFEKLNLGIENTGTEFVISTRNIFTNTNTLYSGNVVNTTDFSDPKSNLRNPENDIYELKPTSNAVNFYSHIDVGSLEFYLNEGIFKSQTISSSIDRYYKTLTLNFLTNQTQPSSLSEIEIEFVNNNKTFKLPQSVLIDTENITSANITLPISIIADQFNLNVYLKSYSFNSTPFIDSIKLSW